MIFLTKFKPYKELSQERFDHLTFIFNRWIELHEWQHYIKWCKKYKMISMIQIVLMIGGIIHWMKPMNTLYMIQMIYSQYTR